MASKTDIANFALAHIAQKTIHDIDSTDDPNAIVCKLYWDIARDTVLTDHTWNFSLKRADLVQTSIMPLFGYQYSYAVPSDFLRCISVNDVSRWGDTATFNVEGREILSNWPEAQLRYVSRVDVTGLYSTEFVNALSLQLASLIAHQVTGSVTIKSAMMEEYTKILSKSRTIDANQNNPQVRVDSVRSDFVKVRRASPIG